MDHKFEQAAKDCASYIFDSDSEQVSYQEFIQDGNDPRDHILYSAALILDKLEDFQIDIDEYLKEQIAG
jgi:hypothetical protein